MRRREDFALRRHTLNLFEGDFERLQTIHGTRIGASKVIRDLIREHLKDIDRKATRHQIESEDAL
jgi:hypothetical protein